MNTQKKREAGRPNETKKLEKIVPEFVNKTPQDMIESEGNANALIIQHQQNLTVIDQKFGDDQPYDFNRLITETKVHLQTLAYSYLVSGRNLVQIREHCDHGEFQKALDLLGLAPRAARKMIQVALKFGGRPALASLNTTKLLQLVTEDDDTLDALERGESVANMTLDDIDKMGSRELKIALRKAKDEALAQAEVHEKLLDLKNQKLDEMDKQFLERTTRVKSWAGVTMEIGANLTTMSAGVVMNVHHLRAQIDQILSEAERFNLSEEEMGAIVVPFQQRITHMYTEFRELIAEFDNNLSGYLPVYNAPQE